jgi:hypothetical protein
MSPRIRSGADVYPTDKISVFNIYSRTVSCEVIYRFNDPLKPTGIQWYNSKGSNLNFNYTQIQISSNFMNISSKFLVVNSNLNLYKRSKFYECCTLSGTLRINCTKATLTNFNKSSGLLNFSISVFVVSFAAFFIFN